MSSSFDVSTEFWASVEQVHAAFGEQTIYWGDRLVTFGDMATLDSLTVGADGAVTVGIMHDLRRLRFPEVAREVLPGGPRMGSEESWQPIVGGNVESYLGRQFAEQLPDIHNFTTAWIAGDDSGLRHE